ncbi:uncharacterized protein [Leuresthes tenuis]|uniref:uncharacterized protein isoform X1 n=1 Tax=Leuresthes tenuis TaxID=355514 RepID=UPI003B511B6B
MLNFIVFSHLWFLLTGLIHCIENSTGLQGQSFTYVDNPPPAVIRLSVPEDHHVCLPCDASVSSDMVWTFQDRKVLVTQQGSYQTNQDNQRYLLLTDGSLCLLQLDDSDCGEYRCNQQLVAELQVLTGHDFKVSAGRTLLLPCSGSSKPKQKWFRQREGERREAIFTRFRNGTEKPELERSRLSYTNNALQIQDLKPEDTGEYLCNGVLEAKVTVIAVQPEPTSILSSTSTTPASAVMKTDLVEIDNKTKKRPENGLPASVYTINTWKNDFCNFQSDMVVDQMFCLWSLSALLLVAVTGLGLMIIFMAVVCILLTSMKCRKKRKHKYAATRKHEDTELQMWKTCGAQTEYEMFETPSLPEETIHYACLGRPNWRERPSWSPSDQSHHNVIYSSVVTRAAAQNIVS